jgi:hypothetical protein
MTDFDHAEGHLTDEQRAQVHAAMKKPPQRAVSFRLEVQADSLEALASVLMNLSLHADRGDLSTHCVSGGYDSGYEQWLEVSDGPTHDEYVAQLNDYLGNLATAAPTLPAPQEERS